MGKIIAVLNQKGGVGKTTTAINVASYIAKSKHQVLLVDLDPQGNATSGLGVDKQKVKFSSYDVLLGRAKLKDAVLSSKNAGLQLLPTNANLAGAEVELVSATDRENKLKTALGNVGDKIVLIDCPPSLGLLTVNSLAAADYVLIPVQAEYYALEGLGQLMSVVQRVRESLNPKLEILGVVVTMFDARTSLSEQVATELRKYFGPKVLKTVIPRNVRLAEAPSFGKPISEHDKWSRGARAYKALTKEILDRLK
jgi:chromosome partitioning protein